MRFRLLVLIMVVAALLLACEADEEDSDDVADDPEAEVDDEADEDEAEVDAATLSLGHVWDEEDSQAQAVQTFADEVADLSGGEIEIDIFPASQIGDDREILEGLEIGSTDVWVGGAGVYNELTPLGQLFVTPFMFDDVDDMVETYDGEVGEDISQAISDETGTEVMAYWPRGPRHLTLNDAVESPDDLDGHQVRVPENPMFLRPWEEWGASPTPMEFGEVFTALEQGTIDGQENPLSLIHSAGFYEVQSHLNLTSHVIEPLIVSISEPTLGELEEDQQDLLFEAAQGAPREQFADVVADEEEEFLGLLEDEGMTVVEPDVEAWQEPIDGLVEDEFDEIAEFYDRITNE